MLTKPVNTFFAIRITRLYLDSDLLVGLVVEGPSRTVHPPCVQSDEFKQT